VEGEKEDGTSSGKKYALLAAKRKATMHTTSTEGPVRRYVNCLVTAYVQLHTLAIFPTPSTSLYVHIGHAYTKYVDMYEA